MNPLLVLDEIDKLSGDYRGDPASALLEALDSEQNHAFRDHFLEIPLDLSQVMFITTPTRWIRFPGPCWIGWKSFSFPAIPMRKSCKLPKNHLLPKQMKEHGLKKGSLRIDEETLRAIIRNYTRESGVRQLERRLAAVCRKSGYAAAVKDCKASYRYRKGLAEAAGYAALSAYGPCGAGGDRCGERPCMDGGRR